jgi:hypothetical protein
MYVNSIKKLMTIRSSDRGLIIQHAYCPLSEPWVLSWDAPICERYVSKHSSNKPIFYHDILIPYHGIKQVFMHFGSIFWGFKNHGFQCLCPSLDTNVFENSFWFPAQGINLHTRTQIWFSKPWWFGVACSSNLNYSHYMARNSFNVLKRSDEARKFSKFEHYSFIHAWK